MNVKSILHKISWPISTECKIKENVTIYDDCHVVSMCLFLKAAFTLMTAEQRIKKDNSNDEVNAL